MDIILHKVSYCATSYCNKECQHADWKLHEKECPVFRQRENFAVAARTIKSEVGKMKQDTKAEYTASRATLMVTDGFPDALNEMAFTVSLGKSFRELNVPRESHVFYIVNSSAHEAFVKSQFEDIRGCFILRWMPQEACDQVKAHVETGIILMGS